MLEPLNCKLIKFCFSEIGKKTHRLLINDGFYAFSGINSYKDCGPDKVSLHADTLPGKCLTMPLNLYLYSLLEIGLHRIYV